MDRISVELAKEDHSRSIWEWRNDPVTRAMSLNQDLVTWENHQKWFNDVLINQGKHIYIGSINSILIGMVKFDKCDKKSKAYTISINTNPKHRGQGLGKSLLRKSIQFFWLNILDSNLILATVKRENHASKRIFESVGFTQQDSSTDVYQFSLARGQELSGEKSILNAPKA